MKIHPTSVIEKGAQLGPDVEVGPFSVIGPNVKIGMGCKIGPHCVIEGNTSLGQKCRVFTGAVIGSIPQDLKFKNEVTYLEIGENNTFREYCTINSGTRDSSKTVIGNNNLFMAYAHIAHDCRIGNDCVIANCGTMAGHVEVRDNVVVGGLAAVHQFGQVGELSIIGGCSKVVQDVPPFSIVDGHPAKIYGLNLIGLKRKGFSPAEISNLKKAFKVLFFSGLSQSHAIDEVRSMPEDINVSILVDFLKNSKRGICR